MIDAPVAIKWVIPEIDSDKTIRLRDGYNSGLHESLAPDLFPTETCNALMMAERRGRILPGEAGVLLFQIVRDMPLLRDAIPLLPRALEIAQFHRQTVCDCLYVVLAEREGCELMSADDRLVRAVQPSLPFVLSLSAMP